MASAPEGLVHPTVSVVVCTYTERRWWELVEAVGSVLQQTEPALEVIVVVDHDDTLLARADAELAAVRVVPNVGERGLSGARNSGVAVTRGDVVAFLDDDAVADRDWLAQLVQPYRHHGVLGVGGTIDPLWVAGRPRSFPPEFDWVVGCTYLGMPTRAGTVRNLIGANMSFRREVFEAVGTFSSCVGRVGTRPAGCEETELCLRAARHWAGGVFVHQPAARVSHRVPPERGGWAYFGARCWAEGLSKAAVASLAGTGPGLASERAYALRALPAGVARGVAESIRIRNLAGVGRGAAIAAGLALTTGGYVTGRASAGIARWQATTRRGGAR